MRIVSATFSLLMLALKELDYMAFKISLLTTTYEQLICFFASIMIFKDAWSPLNQTPHSAGKRRGPMLSRAFPHLRFVAITQHNTKP